MKVFWKVHIRNYDSFIDYINKKYCDQSFGDDIYHVDLIKKIYYDNVDGINYRFLSVDDYRGISGNYYLRQMCYSNESFSVLISESWKYMGEFNGRKQKLDRLNKISKL